MRFQGGHQLRRGQRAVTQDHVGDVFVRKSVPVIGGGSFRDDTGRATLVTDEEQGAARMGHDESQSQV